MERRPVNGEGSWCEHCVFLKEPFHDRTPRAQDQVAASQPTPGNLQGRGGVGGAWLGSSLKYDSWGSTGLSAS